MSATRGTQNRSATFDPVLAADWNQDAATWGVTRRDDGLLFRFVLLAVDGESLDWRLYGLTPLSEDEFGEGHDICEHQWNRGSGTVRPALTNRIGQIEREPLPEFASYVLTSSLGSAPALVANAAANRGEGHHELLRSGASIYERLKDHPGGRVVPRPAFEQMVEYLFGHTPLPDLDSNEADP